MKIEANVWMENIHSAAFQNKVLAKLFVSYFAEYS